MNYSGKPLGQMKVPFLGWKNGYRLINTCYLRSRLLSARISSSWKLYRNLPLNAVIIIIEIINPLTPPAMAYESDRFSTKVVPRDVKSAEGNSAVLPATSTRRHRGSCPEKRPLIVIRLVVSNHHE